MKTLFAIMVVSAAFCITAQAAPGHPRDAWKHFGTVSNIWGAVYRGEITELEYRQSDAQRRGTRRIAGRNVSACVGYGWNELYGRRARIILNYRHVRRTSRDRCQRDACGTHPGFAVFVQDSRWDRGWTRVPAPRARRDFRRHVLYPEKHFDSVLICRGGGGHGRDNIVLGDIRAFRAGEGPRR